MMVSKRRLLATRSRVAHAVNARLGLTLIAPHTAAQIATAKILSDCARAQGWDETTRAAFLGNVEGECSFQIHAWGDNRQATDIEQDHSARRALIQAHTGIDMVTAGAADQFRGILWEMSTAPSPYRHNLDKLKAAAGIAAKVAVLVVKEEQSGSQARDIARRTQFANTWLAYARAHWAPAHA